MMLKVPANACWKEYIAAYKSHMIMQNLSPQTMLLRERWIRHFSRSFEGSPLEIDQDQLLLVLGDKKWSVHTRRSAYTTIRLFFRWIHREKGGKDLEKILPNIPMPAPAPKPIGEAALLDAKNKAAAREKIMIRLASELGIRRAEVAKINNADILETSEGYILYVHGKGNKPRILPLKSSLYAEMQEMFATHNSAYLFPGQINGHISPGRVGELVTELLPKGFSMHTLRHRFATVAHDISKNLLAVQQLIGHMSPTTTQLYVRVTPSQLREIANKI